MHPLSLHGFMRVYPGNVYRGFSEYLIYGGIPSVALENDAQERADLLRSLFREIYLKDIDQRNPIRKSAGIIDLLNAASSSVGSLTNPEKRKNAFRTLKNSNISSATIKRCLDSLEDSFLIEPSERHDIKRKSDVASPRKHYFADSFLRNARRNFRQNEDNHIMENALYDELRMWG